MNLWPDGEKCDDSARKKRKDSKNEERVDRKKREKAKEKNLYLIFPYGSRDPQSTARLMQH